MHFQKIFDKVSNRGEILDFVPKFLMEQLNTVKTEKTNT